MGQPFPSEFFGCSPFVFVKVKNNHLFRWLDIWSFWCVVRVKKKKKCTSILSLPVLLLLFPHPRLLFHFPRTVSDRSFLQNLPFQTSAKVRRRPQGEELVLTQRFAVSLLFYKSTELQKLHSYTETVFRDMVANKQALVTKHLESLSYGDLSPAQILEACHCVHEASFTHEERGRDSGSTQLLTHLAVNLPESLTFHGVPLSPPDVYTVQNALKRAGAEGRTFCLDLEDSGVRICGLRALVGLDSIKTYR